uniref:Secreted protein n=1 Tax=Anopheles darlingi TaxID=43151 RepID=A0A2M4DCT1_ANODA
MVITMSATRLSALSHCIWSASASQYGIPHRKISSKLCGTPTHSGISFKATAVRGLMSNRYTYVSACWLMCMASSIVGATYFLSVANSMYFRRSASGSVVGGYGLY